jgi:ADP-heptose:LPS heptosyltransferase
MLPSAPVVTDVRRIAVLRGNALGDLVVALPALTALRTAYPDASVTLLGRAHHAELLCSRPSPVDEVVVLPLGAIGDEIGATMTADERAGFWNGLAERGWDLAIQLHGGGRNSNAALLGLRARVSVGSRTPDAPQLDRWISYEHYQPEVARYLEVVGLVGAPPVAIEPSLPVTAGDRDALAQELPALDDRPYVVLHPGATDPRRRWPVSSFAEAGAALRTDVLRMVITGTASERTLTGELLEALDGDALLAQDLSLRALVGLLSGAQVVISNDTGPLHVASAAGAPTVGIFWIGNLVNAGPMGRRRDRPQVSWRAACPVCGREVRGGRCGHDVSFVADVDVTDVVAAARSLLGAAA